MTRRDFGICCIDGIDFFFRISFHSLLSCSIARLNWKISDRVYHRGVTKRSLPFAMVMLPLRHLINISLPGLRLVVVGDLLFFFRKKQNFRSLAFCNRSPIGELFDSVRKQVNKFFDASCWAAQREEMIGGAHTLGNLPECLDLSLASPTKSNSQSFLVTQ
jgi:hypothetical protein